MEVPSTMATKVLISSKALARERSASGSISGRMPYLAGLKMVECSAIKNRTSSINSMRVEKKAASPSPITNTSKTLTPIRTLRLLTASARCPE